MKNKITIKNSAKIIDNDYVIKKKKKDINNTYNYLLSRAFNYFPQVVYEDNETIYYKYIEDVEEPKEQKIIDLINLVSLLHNKTTFYMEVDIDTYKYIYESIMDEINSVSNYYNILMDNIEQDVYMSPANYLIARNISNIYDSIGFAYININKWYEMVENKRKMRVVRIHNNLKLEHYIKGDKPYLISWDNSLVDSPIYDLISLYKNHYLDFEWEELIKIYLNKYPLSKEEITLFLVIIAIPWKIEYVDSQYKMVLMVRRMLDYIYKTGSLIKKYGIKEETNK